MRIAFDVAQTCVNRAGCAWHADALARAMAPLVPPGDFILYHHFGEWTNFHPDRGTTIEGVPQPMVELTRPEAIALWAQIEAGAAALPGGPEIVHSNSFMAPITPGAKLVYTVHDLCFWTHPEYTTTINRLLCQRHVLRALDRAAGLHFISETTRSEFERCLPNWLERTQRPSIVARSGLRLQPSPQRPSAGQRFADANAPWLFVGTIEPRKNIDGLLDAYALYWRRSSLPRPLRIVGREGWQAKATMRRIEELGRNLPVEYLGPVDDAALANAYAGAFALVQPSHHEGFGLTMVEGLAFGLPCLASEHQAAAEFRSAAVLPAPFSGAPERAADRLLELEASPENYAALAAAAEQTAAPYRWERAARSLLAFYETLL